MMDIPPLERNHGERKNYKGGSEAVVREMDHRKSNSDRV
jgi:hypothetical protein